MSIARPFAYNTGSTIDGTIQVGSLAIVTGSSVDYSQNNVVWYNGPDEELGYVIAFSAETQPVAGGGTAKLQFWRSKLFTNQSFINISESVSRKFGSPQNFYSAENASTWLTSNGFWNNYYAQECGFSSFNDYVLTTSIQTDGKILVGGFFTSYSGQSYNRIIRLNDDGTIDNTFTIGDGFDSPVRTISIQSDGKILAGGEFTSYSGQSYNRIIRLNDDGTIDDTFSIGDGFGYFGITTISIQTDGKILAGGFYTTYSGQSYNNIIRLNDDGTIDNTFTIGDGFDSTVSTTSIQTDGKILAGGYFTSYSGLSNNYIIRLNDDGTIDNTFTIGSGFNGSVSTISIQTDGKILVGGEFTSYSGQSYNRIIRLNDDGTIDNTFTIGSGFDNIVIDIDIQTDGKILVGGNFTSYSGQSYNRIIRLNDDGTIDNTFTIGDGFDSFVYTISEKTDGKILVGGNFNVIIQPSNRIIRLNNDGTIDNTFTIGGGFNNEVFDIDIQTDGKILVGGNFTSYSGQSYNRIIRLNTGGTIDNIFTIGNGFDIFVYTILEQSDGKILVGGNFTSYSGQSYNRIIRLNSNGTIDTSFTIGSGFNSLVLTILEQSDGKILVGGGFTSYSGQSYNYIIRLNTGGTIDNTFTIGSGFDEYVLTILEQSDGKILAGGFFTSYSGQSYNYIIRLNTGGTIDNTFTIGDGFDDYVSDIEVQSDGKILVGGDFNSYSGQSYNRIIRLNDDGTIDDTFTIGDGFNNTVFDISVQSDGKILVGGDFTSYSGQSYNKIIRLNDDGTIDNTFTIGDGFNNYVSDIEVQSDGKILAGGVFTSYFINPTYGIALLSSNGTLIPPCN